MFCIHCGRQIPDKARFCPRCGGKTEEDIDNSVYPNQKSDLIFKCRSSTQTALAIQIILNFLLIVGCIVGIVITQSIIKESRRSNSNNQKMIWVIIFSMFIVLFLTVLIIKGIKLSAVSSTYLCLSKDGIIGVGGTPSYLGKLSFNYKYRDILDITMVGVAINIITTGGSYKLLLEDSGQAIRELNKRLERSKAEFR